MIHLMSVLVLAANWGFAAWIVIAFIVGAIAGSVITWPWWYKAEKQTDELERTRVSLAACLSIAEGWGMDNMPAKSEWAWSPALQAVYDLRRSFDFTNPERAETSVQRRAAGLPQNLPWQKKFGGEIPYEELEGMFLDQFLLRWFSKLMPDDRLSADFLNSTLPPWDRFVSFSPWAKEIPLMFEQFTGYKLNDIQLNNAIAEYARRLSLANVAKLTPVE